MLDLLGIDFAIEQFSELSLSKERCKFITLLNFSKDGKSFSERVTQLKAKFNFFVEFRVIPEAELVQLNDQLNNNLFSRFKLRLIKI